jgi:hypothetical protein
MVGAVRRAWYQTRLIVIQLPDRRQAARAREVGATLVEQGGPAVLVGEFATGGVEHYRNFYWGLVHDQPLDLAAFISGAALFAGGGREEALRVSSVGLRLLRLEKLASEPGEAGSANHELRDLIRRSARPRLLRNNRSRMD